ncbi:MAG: flagellar biosynthetic protein FliR [Bdellovibrio sp. CG10_big_fil_rev_8_21_14_0_10_47_8]|nr:MAG: flagellar biosynthetic protein FliR [Bdellovibrio sp. CG10_big_fil_rev_8_21_14_0_10_47_8]
MAGLYQFPEGQIIAFALVFLRIMAFVVAWPVFGTSNFPVHVKVLLALVLAMIQFPVTTFENTQLIQINDQIIFMSVRELCLGLALGFLMRMYFFAVSIAGEIMSVTMGLGAAQLYNPAMGSQSNVLEQFEVMLATLFFLVMNGHHLFLGGLAESFHLVPVAAIGLKTEAFASITPMIQSIFLIGLKISAPVLVSIFLAQIAMGIIGRAVPQINVLVTSFPVTVLLGLAVLIVTTPLFVGEMDGLTNVMAARFFQFMKVL